MRKPIWKRIAALTLSAALVLSLAACGGEAGGKAPADTSAPAATEPVNDAVAQLAGAYAVDITDLGMPITFYLVIREDGTFQLTNEVTDGAATGADKGNGKVGESGGVYMLVYSDSTAEASKTATFELDGSNLVFTTTLPYGSSNISPNLDGETPIYPVAKSMAYGAYLGDYAGTLAKEVAAMNTTIVYDYCLNLAYGAEYTFESSFTVMGEAQTYVQSGAFSVEDGKLTLTSADGAVAEGTISEAGEIAIAMPLSAMSKGGDDITMQRATTADYAGSYVGVKNMEMGPMTMSVSAALKLDMLGGYTYTASMEGEEDYVQTGTYAPNADGTLTFTADEEGAEAQTGTRNGSDSLTASFKISSAVPMATEIVFFSDRVQGVFEADDMEGKGSHGTLTLNPDGTYHFALSQDGSVVSEEDGSFTTGTGMAGDTVNLVSAAGAASSGSISDGGINLNYTLASGDSLGYQLVPVVEESAGMGGGMPSGMGGSSEAPATMGQ